MSSSTVVTATRASNTNKVRLGSAVRAVAVATAATAAIAACAAPSSTATGSRVVQAASAQLGKPYVYGATGPGAFDCSGLTSSAYRAAGKFLPRTALEQYNVTLHIPASQARPGDLVFMGTPGSHVGIWVSPGQMIDAGNARVGVSRRAMWSSQYAIGRVR